MSQKFDIQQLAELVRLHLKPDERAKLSRDLEKILAYVEQLQTLETDQVQPTSHVLQIENVFRKDIVKPSKVRESVLKYAPKRSGQFFKVPKVIEET